MAEDVAEACHSGTVSWEKQHLIQQFYLKIIVRNWGRLAIIRDYFCEKGIDKETISVRVKISSKLINLAYLLDHSSTHHPAISKTDHSPVSSINFIKKRLQVLSSCNRCRRKLSAGKSSPLFSS